MLKMLCSVRPFLLQLQTQAFCAADRVPQNLVAFYAVLPVSGSFLAQNEKTEFEDPVNEIKRNSLSRKSSRRSVDFGCV